jgi:Tol biopolymer transport system component
MRNKENHQMRHLLVMAAAALLTGCVATKTVTITSSPPGATIFVEGQQQAGTSPITTKLEFQPKTAAYDVTAKLPGFQDGRTTIAYQSKDKTEYVVTLERYRKDVQLTSVPDGATVFTNGQQAGPTPLTLKELVFDDADKPIGVTFHKDGYKDAKTNISYQPTNRTEYVVTLERYRKNVKLTSVPDGATVFLNGQQAGTTPLTKELVFDNAEQPIEVTFKKDGYKDAKTNISYQPSERTEYVVTLERYRKNVKLTSVPDGATVFLNGQQAGITPLIGKEIVFDAAEKPIEVTFRKDGYKDAKTNISYEPSQKTDYSVILEKVETVSIELLSIEPQQTDKGVKLALVRKPTLAYLETIERSPNVASVTRVTANEDNGVSIDTPVVSPTEEVILFGEFVEEEKGLTYCNLQKQKIGSSAKMRLTYGKYLDSFPAFTPDGKRVVFSSNRTSSNPILWIVSAEEPIGIAMLTHTLAEDFSPSVSSETNNNLVVFASNPPNAEEPQIWSVHLDGGMETQLREGEYPQISPDCRKILFIRRDKITKKKQLWVMNIEGSGETQLTQNTDYEIFSARWSPDGKWITYASDEGLDSQKRHNRDIWLMTPDGSKRTQLTTNGSYDDSPCWDSKGEYIYFRSNRGGAWNIWRVKPKPILAAQ